MARRRGFAPLCALVAFAMLSGASAAGLRQIPAAYETQRLAPAGQEAGSAAPPEAGSGNNFHQMKEVAQNDPRSAMEMLKSAARDIRAKFHEAQKSPKFGIGMRRRTVRRIAQESEEFWDFLENIDKVQDVDSWTSSDGTHRAADLPSAAALAPPSGPLRCPKLLDLALRFVCTGGRGPN